MDPEPEPRPASQSREFGRALPLPALAALALVVSGCAVPRREARLPGVDRAFVAVLSGQMPPPIDRVARHAWIVTHHSNSKRYPRFEMGSGSEQDPFDDFASGDVMLHGVVEMSDDELRQKEACMGKAKRDYDKDHPDYFAIPGPNSNTLVAYLLRRCGLHIELPATAIGRDFVGVVGAQRTEAGTGVQLGTIPLGLRLGLQEGAEIQFFGLPFGVHLWPPGLTVPVNPGRIGIDTDGHVQRRFRKLDRHKPRDPDRAVGAVALFARGSRAVHPSLASGLEGMASVGLTARGLYGGRAGLGIGLDLEAGGSWPAGFAGDARLFPLGAGYALSPTGFVGFFSGVGVSRVGEGVPAALVLPQEARVELDLQRRAHLALVAQGIFAPSRADRSPGWLIFDETSLSLRASFGDVLAYREFSFASRMFFGFERRTLLGSPFLGLIVGSEIGASAREERGRRR